MPPNIVFIMADDPGTLICPAMADGINRLPILEGQAPVTSHTLFWRYKSSTQRAMRDGDLKYLKIRANTFLFNVVQDPRERANLKHRRPDDHMRMAAAWQSWNAAMLPEVPDSFAEVFTAVELADHMGCG